MLVPIQNVYPKNGEQKRGANNEDYIILLSSHLHTLTKSILPAWDKIFSQAEDVLKTFKEKDSVYYDHIVTGMKDGMQPVDVHNFAYEILVKGHKKSIKVWNDLEKKRRRNWKESELEIFGDVAIYIRKWISEGFAGIFSNPTILFIWDYLFMNNWKCMRKLCIVVLSLLRPWAMRARSQRELVRVLNEEPSRIYLQDLRRGLMAYDRDNIDTVKIANCNSNIEIIATEKKEVEPTSAENEIQEDAKTEPGETKKDENAEDIYDQSATTENENASKEDQANTEQSKLESDEKQQTQENPTNSTKDETEKTEDTK